MFRIPKDTEMTLEVLSKYMTKHKALVSGRYQPLMDMYTSDHDILHCEKKPDFKPDNRIVVNFAKYIVDSMNGFFLGNPIKIKADDDSVNNFIEFLDQYNDQDDNNSELSRICSIFGKGYEMYYTDEFSELCITYLKPTEAFMIFDDSILERPLFFIRHYLDEDNVEHGSVSDGRYVRYFKTTGGYRWESEWEPHYFDGVPATEYVENEERQGIFEPVITMINAYNKAISEKANDVDYFADAYLKVLGAILGEEGLKNIRSNRIINFPGDGADKMVVEFLQKPDGDATQENLINRLERLIFQISMVANISDENFGGSSGIALKYKLQSMSNLEKTKERKFISGMNRRYKILFSHPRSRVQADAWIQLHYQFTPNIPANLLEESQIAGNLSGITSQETQLKVLSCVDNIKHEIDKIKEDTDNQGYSTDYPTNRTVVEDVLLGGPSGTTEQPD